MLFGQGLTDNIPCPLFERSFNYGFQKTQKAQTVWKSADGLYMYLRFAGSVGGSPFYDISNHSSTGYVLF